MSFRIGSSRRQGHHKAYKADKRIYFSDPPLVIGLNVIPGIKILIEF